MGHYGGCWLCECHPGTAPDDPAALCSHEHALALLLADAEVTQGPPRLLPFVLLAMRSLPAPWACLSLAWMSFDRNAWLPAPTEGNRDALRVVLCAGVLARLSQGLGGGPSLPVQVPASSWVQAAVLVDEYRSEVVELAEFLDQVLLLPGDQLDLYWAGGS